MCICINSQPCLQAGARQQQGSSRATARRQQGNSRQAASQHGNSRAAEGEQQVNNRATAGQHGRFSGPQPINELILLPFCMLLRTVVRHIESTIKAARKAARNQQESNRKLLRTTPKLYMYRFPLCSRQRKNGLFLTS